MKNRNVEEPAGISLPLSQREREDLGGLSFGLFRVLWRGPSLNVLIFVSLSDPGDGGSCEGAGGNGEDSRADVTDPQGCFFNVVPHRPSFLSFFRSLSEPKSNRKFAESIRSVVSVLCELALNSRRGTEDRKDRGHIKSPPA